jgi:hypothetical protein
MRLIQICVIVLSLSVNSFAKLAGGSPESSKMDQKTLVLYLNSFDSAEDMVLEYQNLGLLSAKDLQCIIEVIKRKNVNAKAKLPPLVFSNGQFSVGNVGWVFKEGGVYKTFQGKFVRFSKAKTSAEVFETMFSALTENIVSAEVLLGATKSALSFMIEYGIRMTDSSLALGPVIESVGWPIRKMQKGTVQCKGKDYEYILNEAAGPLATPRINCASPIIPANWFYSGDVKVFCRFARNGFKFTKDSFVSRGSELFVGVSKLDQIFNAEGLNYPPCTQESLKKVDIVLKDEMKMLSSHTESAAARNITTPKAH